MSGKLMIYSRDLILIIKCHSTHTGIRIVRSHNFKILKFRVPKLPLKKSHIIKVEYTERVLY